MQESIQITVNEHSSIRLEAEKVLRFDPFNIVGTPHDADIIFITHDHYDHFSPLDIAAVRKPDTVYVMPESMRRQALGAGMSGKSTVFLKPGQTVKVGGLTVDAVPAYNIRKQFHTREKGWLGYVVTVGGKRFYVCGDTDDTPEARAVKCDTVFIPIGGKFTMDARESAALANALAPVTAVPVHYGSVAGRPEDADVFEKNVSAGVTVLRKLFI